MNMQLIRRSVLAVLLVAPVSVFAQTSPVSKAATPTASVHPDLRPGKVQNVLTQEQLQAIMNPATRAAAQPAQAAKTTQTTQTIQNDSLSDVVVRGASEAGTKSRIPIEAKPCGLASIVWFLEHPAEGWRVFAPVTANNDLDVCLKPPLDTTVSPYPPL